MLRGRWPVMAARAAIGLPGQLLLISTSLGSHLFTDADQAFVRVQVEAKCTQMHSC